MSSIENISPAVIRKISRELHLINGNPPEGIRVIINEDDVCDIQAWIWGPEGTPYEYGCFKVKLVLGSDFPAAPPKCYFVTKIFHPNVSKSGEVCVNTLKKDWNKELGLIHILLTVKCLLIVPNPESALNEEAGRLLLENYSDYAKHARLMTSIHASCRPTASSTPSPSTTSTAGAPTPTRISNANNVTTAAPAPQTPTTTQNVTSSPKKMDKDAASTDSKIIPETKVMSEDSSVTHVTPLVSPLAVSNTMNEPKNVGVASKKGLMGANNAGGLASVPKKRPADKKVDKKQADKKRSLKRL